MSIQPGNSPSKMRLWIRGLIIVVVFLPFALILKNDFATHTIVQWSELIAEINAGNVTEVTVAGSEIKAVLLESRGNDVTRISASGPSDPLPEQQLNLLTDLALEYNFSLKFRPRLMEVVWLMSPWFGLMALFMTFYFRLRRIELQEQQQ